MRPSQRLTTGLRRFLTELKKFLGQSLIASSKALKQAKNPETIKQLRADRAVIIELLKNTKVEEEQQ